MDARKSRILAWSAGALLTGIVAACASPAPDTSHGTASAVTERPFDRNAVLDDKSMRDAEGMTAASVQKFLDKTPWGTRSALATYSEGGKTAAQIMVDTAKAHGINPLAMLVRVQMEQGLVSKTTAPATSIALAFGCGCPHSPVCSDAYRGFANQAECAAGTLRRSMDKAVTSTGTVSGWARGKSKTSEDGLTIVPKNAVTAALYTYTPWVGEAGGGKQGVGGVSLHAQVWDRFAESASYGAWATQTSGAQDADSGAEPDATTPTQDPPANPSQDPGTDAGPEPTTDAGPPDPAPGDDAGPSGESGSKGPPDNGSDDSKVIGSGNAPPASNAPPPSSRSTTPGHPEELPAASEEELAAKNKSSQSGCSTARHGGASNAWLVGIALALVAARRRARPHR